MELKIVNDDSKVVSVSVVECKSVNSSLILNMDEKLNDMTKIDAVNTAISEIETEKLISKFEKTVKDALKKNNRIPYEYDEIKDRVFKFMNKHKFEETNNYIDELLMELEIMDEKVQKVYNSFDFWATHNDQKLEKMISNYNRLLTYKKLYEKKVGNK